MAAAALGLLWLLAFAGVGGSGGPGPVSPLPGHHWDAAPVTVLLVSEQELRSLSEQLYSADENRAGTGDIVLHLQHRVTAEQARAGTDYAAQRLFSYVAEERLFSRPTFSRFLALLDNYEEVTGHDETVTAKEEKEEEAFLDAVFQTRVMATLTSFFLAKGLYPSEEAFRADLKEMWFGLYSRSSGKALDSSGFEHIFHGEIKKGKVLGCHSWVQLYALERSGRLNYLSYSYDGPWDTFPDVLALQYRWSGYLKSVGSTFVGSSPEFDLALYTLCYKTRPDRQCHVSLGGKAATIQTYSWANSFYGDNERFVASSYPLSP
ncbi:uridylate-specific endoribonuclease C-like [Grus americana]|uniref:uridylate-specific endoribonuclease C-like n=1 Tax=Grus americana TaxID=9117 RepID=UPI00240789DD|nr:uridylate-specific endoribonuclease C-like [Grus americana]